MHHRANLVDVIQQKELVNQEVVFQVLQPSPSINNIDHIVMQPGGELLIVI